MIGSLAVMPQAGWQPSSSDVEELGALAQTWLKATVTLYVLDAMEGLRLMEALRVLTRVEDMEAKIAEVGLLTSCDEAHPLLAGVSRERRLFLSMWTDLRLGKA